MHSLATRLRALAHVLRNRVRDERGQTSAEYVGLIVLIAVMVVAFIAAAPGIATTITSGITNLINTIVEGGL